MRRNGRTPSHPILRPAVVPLHWILDITGGRNEHVHQPLLPHQYRPVLRVLQVAARLSGTALRLSVLLRCCDDCNERADPLPDTMRL